MTEVFKWLMVVDMQDKFLNVWKNRFQYSNIPKLINNVCDSISDAIKRKKKIIIVEFEGNGHIHEQIKKALNWEEINVLKNKPYFEMLEVRKQKYGLTYQEVECIETVELCWVNTIYCVREAFSSLQYAWIDPSLVLWATLNTCHDWTSLGTVRTWYQMKWMNVQFTCEEKWKDSLEDYL
jgi:nicotinamidase-related amidase